MEVRLIPSVRVSAKAWRITSDPSPSLRLTLALPAKARTLDLTYTCRSNALDIGEDDETSHLIDNDKLMLWRRTFSLLP